MDIIKANLPVFNELWEKEFRKKKETVLCSPLHLEYEKEYAKGIVFEDLSFIVKDKEEALSYVVLSKDITPDNKAKLSGFNMPVCYTECNFLNNSKSGNVRRIVKSEFERIIGETDPDHIIYRDFLKNGSLTFLGHYLLELGATASPFLTQVIDLSLTETELHHNVRKSYKSLINWGQKNLELCILDSESITLNDIEDFRRLHIQEAGRKTRSKETWIIQYEMVKNDEAFIILGKIANELVTAALFVHNYFACNYWVGASKRDIFDKPLSHCIIWQAIMHAKKIGCINMEMGEQLYVNQGSQSPSKKEVGISTFKRGFGGETKVYLDVTLKR